MAALGWTSLVSAPGDHAGSPLRFPVNLDRFGEAVSYVLDEDAQGLQILGSYQHDCRSEMGHYGLEHS